MELYSTAGFQNRYYAENQEKLMKRADNTNTAPFIYQDYDHLYKNSIANFQHKTGFNPHKLIEFAEHPHRLQHHATVKKLGTVDGRHHEHIKEIHHHPDGKGENSHGSSKIDGIKFMNY